ncbi:MAG: hypothetical protein SVX38_08650 [Chloroflexota bacterium]|nr:hypothetical protein [Chloroflexota bacterium]
MIEIHLYGNLRRYASDTRPDRDSVVWLEPATGETIQTLLGRLGIPPTEVCHVFLNGALLSTDNTMARWLRYQQAQENVSNRDRGLDVLLKSGDRVGLFARDMALLVV